MSGIIHHVMAAVSPRGVPQETSAIRVRSHHRHAGHGPAWQVAVHDGAGTDGACPVPATSAIAELDSRLTTAKGGFADAANQHRSRLDRRQAADQPSLNRSGPGGSAPGPVGLANARVGSRWPDRPPSPCGTPRSGVPVGACRNAPSVRCGTPACRTPGSVTVWSAG